LANFLILVLKLLWEDPYLSAYALASVGQDTGDLAAQIAYECPTKL